MRRLALLALSSVLGVAFAGCQEDRPLIVAENDAGAQSGAAGNTSTGAAGTTPGGAAGSLGAAGTTGLPASTGAAGTGVPTGCDIAPILQTNFCTLAGACHDAFGSAAHLDLASPGWEQRLVGRAPSGGGMTPSMCTGQGRVYLAQGTLPAVGLLLQKLMPNPPCGLQMPLVGPPYLTQAEMACVQSWANALVQQ